MLPVASELPPALLTRVRCAEPDLLVVLEEPAVRVTLAPLLFVGFISLLFPDLSSKPSPPMPMAILIACSEYLEAGFLLVGLLGSGGGTSLLVCVLLSFRRGGGRFSSSSSSSEELGELANFLLRLTWVTFGVGSSFIVPDEGGPSIALCANALSLSFSFAAVARASCLFRSLSSIFSRSLALSSVASRKAAFLAASTAALDDEDDEDLVLVLLLCTALTSSPIRALRRPRLKFCDSKSNSKATLTGGSGFLFVLRKASKYGCARADAASRRSEGSNLSSFLSRSTATGLQDGYSVSKSTGVFPRTLSRNFFAWRDLMWET
mmetsp:Transcript_27820/g.55622  ORF Transcript_27820/g.55622 Transcript_27820/m.55622 type:complete len:321 (-) Transcript_27820:795-1757(-)